MIAEEAIEAQSATPVLELGTSIQGAKLLKKLFVFIELLMRSKFTQIEHNYTEELLCLNLML